MVERGSPIPCLCGFGSPPLTTTGGWYDGGGRSPSPMRCRFASMKNDIQRLYDICVILLQSQNLVDLEIATFDFKVRSTLYRIQQRREPFSLHYES